METAKLTDMVLDIRDRLARLEDGMKDTAPRPWVELFVRDFVQPVKDSMQSIEHSMDQLAREAKGTYEAFNEYIKKEEKRKETEAEAKEAERKENTLGKRVIRWGAYAAVALTLITIFRVLGTIAETYIKTHAQ